MLGNSLGNLQNMMGTWNRFKNPRNLNRPPPASPTPSKRPSTKKGTAFDWPANIIPNAFKSKYLDVFYCWKKKIFMFNIAPLVFPMCLFNTPITTCYFVVPCWHSCFFFFFSFVFLSCSVLFGCVFVIE
jgi:hypothetical protein